MDMSFKILMRFYDKCDYKTASPGVILDNWREVNKTSIGSFSSSAWRWIINAIYEVTARAVVKIKK